MPDLQGKLNDAERYIIVTALRTAAEQYKRDAALFREPRQGECLATNERLAKQFDKQAEDAESWMMLIEDAETVLVL